MRAAAYFILLATLMLWSGNWIVARAVRADIAPGVATMGRLLLVLAVLAPLVWRSLPGKLRALGARDWRVLAALGLVVPNPGPTTSAGDAFAGMVRGILYNARLAKPKDSVLIRVVHSKTVPTTGPAIVLALLLWRPHGLLPARALA